MICIRSTNPDGSNPVMLGALGEISGWKHTHMYPGGPTSASFTFQGSSQVNHPALQGGRFIYAYSGSALVWAGRLNSPQKGTPWNLTAVGSAAMAKDHINGNLTTLDTQVDVAIGNGLPWTRPNTLAAFNPSPPLGQTSPLSATSTLDDLLGQTVSQGNYWVVTPQGVLSMSSAPVFGGSYLLYITDWPAQTQSSDFATVIYGLYSTGQVVVTATAAQLAVLGRIEATFDTGEASSGAATTAAQQKLAELLTPAWSEQFTAQRGQLLTTGGVPVDLATVDANITARICALQTGDSYGVINVDIPMGQVDYDDDSGTLLLTPSTSALDDFANILGGGGIVASDSTTSNVVAKVNQLAAANAAARGSVTAQTANANGIVLIPHGLGYIPTWAQATPNIGTSTNNFNCRIPSMDATNLFVQFFLNGTEASSVSGLGCFWEAA